MDLQQESLAMHLKNHGKMEIRCKAPLNDRHDLAVAYTPGVAEPCKEIKKHPEMAFEYTCRGNMAGICTDGTRVLGLGDIGAAAAMPVMEGKAVLFKRFGGVDAIPVCINEKDPDKFVAIVKALETSFAAINLEDISSPKCYDIEDKLKERDVHTIYLMTDRDMPAYGFYRRIGFTELPELTALYREF